MREKTLSKKILLLIISVAIITTTILTGTLASLSATYTWHSDEGVVGAFDFTDTTLSLDLFGDKAIFPSDCGSSVLGGAEFGDQNLSWSFSEINNSNIPVLFYVDDGVSRCGFYSTFDFASNFATYFLKLDADTFLECSQVSNSSSDLAIEFCEGLEVCWIWPDKLYLQDGINYVEVTDDIHVDEYIKTNENLCKTSYDYTYDGENMLQELSNSNYNLKHIVSGEIADGYTIETIAPSSIKVESDKLFHGESFLPLYSETESVFFIPQPDYVLSSGDCYLFYSQALDSGIVITGFAESGLNYEIVGNSVGSNDFTQYHRNAQSTEITISGSNSFPKPVVKVFACEISEPAATLCVTISVEISV